MDKIKSLQTSDGIVSADLSVPKEMGGPGKPETATPEDLFAAGYAACFLPCGGRRRRLSLGTGPLGVLTACIQTA